METTKPIYWYQGLFLQPHHFQLQDRYFDASFAHLTRQLGPHYWGVGRLEVDESELQNEILSVKRGEFIFQDGSCVIVPGNGRVCARSFSQTGYKEGQSLTAFLGLAKWKTASKNVTELDESNAANPTNTRFVCKINPVEVSNHYQEGNTAQIRLMDYDIRIFWTDEISEITDYFLMPIAQLHYDGKEVKLSDNFIPPAFSLSGSEVLLQTLLNIREQIYMRCRQLEKYKIPMESKKPEFSPSYLSYVLLLQSLSKYVPWLYHLTGDSNVHPWVVYGVLRQLVGELSTFTGQIDVLGRFEDSKKLLPEYDHENLSACFEKAKTHIRDLLHAILIVPEHVIPLKREESLFTAGIPLDAFGPKNEYYLSITIGEESEEAIRTVEDYVKISSIDNIQTLIDRALPGIPLKRQGRESDRPLQVLPKSPGRHFFKLDTDHDQWHEVQNKKNIAVYWSGAPEDAIVEILILS